MGFALTAVANPGQSQGPACLLPGIITSVQTRLVSPGSTFTDRRGMAQSPQGIHTSSGEEKPSPGFCPPPAWAWLSWALPKAGLVSGLLPPSPPSLKSWMVPCPPNTDPKGWIHHFNLSLLLSSHL